MAANPGFIKTYNAEGAIAPRSIVKVGANDFGALQAGAVGDFIIGVSTDIAAASGERVDVIHTGLADVTLAGTVARGTPVTSNASGLGVAAAPSAGTNNRIIGFAQISGVSGDVIPVLLSLGQIQG
jgi:hypothetical protein